MSRGENIIREPGDLIYNQYRDVWEPFGGFIIGAPEGTDVLAVAEGKIRSAGYYYSPDPFISYGDDVYKKCRDFVIKEKGPGAVAWIYYGLGIESAPGEVIYYNGLTAPAEREFRTGEVVGKGKKIGQVGHYIPEIESPAIRDGMEPQWQNRRYKSSTAWCQCELSRNLEFIRAAAIKYIQAFFR